MKRCLLFLYCLVAIGILMACGQDKDVNEVKDEEKEEIVEETPKVDEEKEKIAEELPVEEEETISNEELQELLKTAYEEDKALTKSVVDMYADNKGLVGLTVRDSDRDWESIILNSSHGNYFNTKEVLEQNNINLYMVQVYDLQGNAIATVHASRIQ